MLTPHMGSLAEALTKQGYSVTFVANEILSKERKFQGWNKAHLVNAKFILYNLRFINSFNLGDITVPNVTEFVPGATCNDVSNPFNDGK